MLDGEAEREKSPARALVTVCDTASEVLVRKLLLPLYVAVIEWSPTGRPEVEYDAVPELSVAVPSWVDPSLNVTVPVAVGSETVAVKVADCPKVEGLLLEARRVVEGALFTEYERGPEVLVR